MNRAVLVNKLDKQRLLETIDFSGTPPDHLDELHKRLFYARVLRPFDVPPQLVTMNSVVRIADAETGEEETYALVYPGIPHKAAPSISADSHLGSALFSRWVGEEVTFRGRRHEHRVVVKGLEYQPESAGHFFR